MFDKINPLVCHRLQFVFGFYKFRQFDENQFNIIAVFYQRLFLDKPETGDDLFNVREHLEIGHGHGDNRLKP